MKYTYDPFQLKAIQAIDENRSVLVAAPTGSGKTAIAEYVIEKCLSSSSRLIYTAPIKAISNQKYRDFMSQFPDKVGILTGDVSINPDAQVLIMTTEIYRNRLFEHPEKHRQISWVIFDEVHYLDDRERGTVWEEAIMFSHPETRFLALSATAPNVRELADWIAAIHNHPIDVVLETHRPVQLVHMFQCQNVIYTDLAILKKDGYMGMNLWSSREHRGGHRHGRRFRGRRFEEELRAKPNSTHDLLQHLIQTDKLPCLYFAFGRKRVEQLAQEHTHLNLIDAAQRHENQALYDKLTAKYDLGGERSAAEMSRLVQHGIAFHHAGMLPTLKEVVEQLFTAKRIQLIFTTETFALGINMPARTVIFDELRKFYGFGFDQLTTRDYYQMAGRAGRRGIDTQGYVYSRVNPHQIAHASLIRIVDGDMEPIRSQFNASYATLLNLYKNLRRSLVDVYPRSLHYFQSGSKGHRRAVGLIEQKLNLLEFLDYITPSGLTAKGEFASSIYGYELVLSELLEGGFLNQLNATELCVLLVALVYEPRPKEHLGRLPGHFHYLERESRRALKRIHEAEDRFKILPPTKSAHFHLSAAMEAWIQGVPFHDLVKKTDVDEGILIRYFRMVIQLLRQLKQAPKVTPRLRQAAQSAIQKINRDLVDAEKQLRNM